MNMSQQPYTTAFCEIAETLSYFDDWQDKYSFIIDLGKSLDALPQALCTEATKVQGCASQVWIALVNKEPTDSDLSDAFRFKGNSDAIIVRGLIAILMAFYNGMPHQQAVTADVMAALKTLGLDQHLSSQRSNGLRAMIERLRSLLVSS